MVQILETREKAIRKAIRINQVIFFQSLLLMAVIAFYFKIVVRMFLFGPNMSMVSKYITEIGVFLVVGIIIFICSIFLFALTVSLYEDMSELQIPGRICFLISGVCFPFLVFALPFLTIITAILSLCSWVQMKKARTP